MSECYSSRHNVTYLLILAFPSTVQTVKTLGGDVAGAAADSNLYIVVLYCGTVLI